MPVRLHRQAPQGQLRREDHRRRRAACCGRRCSPRTSRAQPGLLQRLDARVEGRRAARPADRRRRSSTTSPCCVGALRRRRSRWPRASRAPARRSSSSGSGCSSRSSPASSCCRRRSTSITPGDIVVPLGPGSARVGLTAQGLTAAATDRRSASPTSISLVVLLTLTTPWARLLAALRALLRAAHVRPRARAWPTATCSTCSTRSPTCTPPARRARSAPERDARSGRAFVAATAGALFGKAHALVGRGAPGDGRAAATAATRARSTGSASRPSTSSRWPAPPPCIAARCSEATVPSALSRCSLSTTCATPTSTGSPRSTASRSTSRRARRSRCSARTAAASRRC